MARKEVKEMALVRRERSEWPDLFRRFFDTDWDPGWLRVEEFRDGDDLVVRAELPGIDPDKDVEVSLSDGMLSIRAHRQEQSEPKEGYRSEFRYGSFSRIVALPPGTDESSVTAHYTDGVLEVRAPIGAVPKEEVTRVPVTRA
ncbi:MAG TPA: Hsp20/alpha crystallin family protein [Acidimicrobiales bacterium]|nr:Hsp20/alpha crystallin family protein [Acidimicrobiales bacterium]